jgi:EAL domain-containing protein (putative c-di-GMP-specific phosphodiesterase class I)/CRP-like cAMP-binding protein
VRETQLLRKTLTAGEYLFREGDVPASAFLIEEGAIEIRAVRAAARAGEAQRPMVLARLGPGDLLGEMSVVDQSPRTATAVALVDSMLLVIDSEQIRDRLADADPIVRMLLDGQMKRYRGMLSLLRGGGLTDVVTYDAHAADADSAIDADPGLSKFRLESHLRDALSQHKLEVKYQPILEIATNRIAGYEALVRWDHPTRGPVSPEEFIKLAEETSLIVPVGEYVFDTACAALERLRADPMPFVAVNVSARQLANEGLMQRVVERREALGLPPGCIKVEITESQTLDYCQVAEVIEHCHANHIAVSLDDFGTGYSHLTHLHQLDFDVIKIDQAFVREMFTSERAMSIVRAIVALAQAIHADLVVEGVETREQLDLLEAALAAR